MTPDSPVADVVIVGSGPVAMAIGYAFTRRGMRDVLVCPAGNEDAAALGAFRARGTIGGPGPGGGAVYRPTTAPALAAMAAAGVRLFENASDELGEDVGFRRCGRLVAVAAADPDAADTGAGTRRAPGIGVRRVSPEEAGTHWPELIVDASTGFTHDPGAGYADARRTARALARAARRAGAAFLPRTPAVGLSARRDRVTGVRLGDGREVACGTVVVAAGVDAPALLAPLGVSLPLRAAREVAVRIRVGRALGERPILVDPTGRWLRPDGPDRLLVGTPDPGTAGADPAAHALAHLAARLPSLPDPVPDAAFDIRYDAGPDHLPLIGSTGPDGLFVAAGCDEHGLGVAPGVGMLVADLLCDGASGRPDIPGTDFRPGRSSGILNPGRA
ncbi:NAD(P)/FAD-dependent oxidoreductase [Embleya hyalina]|uniref:Oxidoreductase n=1 Tax=Embleya hyalina TaxID=516124 RepID=A0A401Z0K5_9ACTN|nr:FAD-binding oxidoreductase [Embleya hyalina]GCE00377.1 oxidoreductase [Embleya hyalina]